MCDYRERFAAAGKFPGGFLKREGRPSTKDTLTSRLTDRPIRPLFPKGFNDEVMCQSTVVASDALNDGDVIAMNGIAAALHISPLPFAGNTSGVPPELNGNSSHLFKAALSKSVNVSFGLSVAPNFSDKRSCV